MQSHFSQTKYWKQNIDLFQFRFVPFWSWHIRPNTFYIPLISRVRGPYGKLWTEFFSFLLWPKREARRPWKQGRKKRGSITCCTDRANEANKMFIIWLCRLFRFWKGGRELAVRTATYGPGIDQSQHAKSVSHIIINIMCHPNLIL